MSFVEILIAALALVATIWGVYYARGQLREAQRVQQQNQTFIENQKKDDDLWSEKCVSVSQQLCVVAPRFIQGNANRPSGEALCLLFPDHVTRNRILSHLIEKQCGLVYTMRPLDVNQLRLKPMRDLIDLALTRIEEFKTQDPELAGRMGL
jgi:hypothetical protein